MIIRLAGIGLLAVGLSACATVTRGTSTAWEVQTEPSGARVETSHGHMCPSTPCAMKMPRKSEFNATITKPGYKPLTIAVTNKIAGAGSAGMAGNVILGGLIGVAVDANSGAMKDLTPNPAVVKLEKEEPPQVAAAPAPTPAAAETPAAAPVATPLAPPAALTPALAPAPEPAPKAS